MSCLADFAFSIFMQGLTMTHFLQRTGEIPQPNDNREPPGILPQSKNSLGIPLIFLKIEDF